MDSDDPAPSLPRKRARSPSPATFNDPIMSTSAGLSEATQHPQPPPSKRVKRNTEPEGKSGNTNASAMAGDNPLNRRVLKRDAKKARKAERKRAKVRAAGMEVDAEPGEEGLAFTFMANVDGVVAVG